jgi:hypothetical protein
VNRVGKGRERADAAVFPRVIRAGASYWLAVWSEVRYLWC